MKLWLILPRTDLRVGDNPWSELYWRVIGFVIRAETEQAARQLAHEHSASESNFLTWDANGKWMSPDPWLESKYSSCVELLPDGDPGIVMRNLHTA